ncbi:MAG TPA: SLC13 family permease [Candidatus Fraserbacteria bacterium]|nr:SLC13 family permease [Candidatus Fraserbacteria bacterium]
MSPVITLLIIIAAALVLFVSERFPIPLVALSISVVLMLTGLVTPAEGISGFSSPATITVLAMFVLSAGLQKTGIVRSLGELIIRFAGGNQYKGLAAIMLVAGGLSAFINNTAVVVVLLPTVIILARRTALSPAKLLIPLSFSSMLGGLGTLIGTSTNILASDVANKLGYGPISMFEFTKLGVIVFLVGGVYLLLFSGRLLPERRGPREERTESYHLRDYLTELVILPDSPLVGSTVAQCRLRQLSDADVLEIIRAGSKLEQPFADERLQAGDVLMVRGKVQTLLRVRRSAGIKILPEVQLRDSDLVADRMGLLEVLISPTSHLIGRTLEEIRFRNRYNATVLAIQRHGEAIREQLSKNRLAVGDALLIQGPSAVLEMIQASPNFIIVGEVPHETLRREKTPIALGIIIGVVLLAALNVLPILVTALAGAVLMVLTGCLEMSEFYEAVRWDVIFLLAGIIPLGLALENTGAAASIAQYAVGLSSVLPPLLILGLFYVLSMLLTEMISNNATVVLLIPIATAAATDLGLNPQAFIMTVMFAASMSFLTPIGYQANTLVYSAGGYKFTDFFKVGAPISLILIPITVYLISVFWPL